jgi:hypothetical protein
MGTLSIWHWLIFLASAWLSVVYWIALVRILNRTGYRGWWSLLSLVPVVNVVALWRFSKAAWPATTHVSKAGLV